MNKILFLLGSYFAILSTGISSADFDEWQSFKTEYSKQYPNKTEENRRMQIFLAHKRDIDKHNELFQKGVVRFKMGLNMYSDLETEEFTERINGNNFNDPYPNDDVEESDYFVGSSNIELPKSIDWRNKGAVTAIKHQKHCGSCWAFSAVGAIESAIYIKYGGPLKSLSAQNLVDCSSKYANLFKNRYHSHGCHGGHAEDAFNYVIKHGINTEMSYPYHGKDNVCKYINQKSNITIRDYKHIPKGDELKLQEAIAFIGPVSVSIHSLKSFHHYKGGIYFEPDCSSTYHNHKVLAIGYGTDEYGEEYYIIKNSWSRHWGEDGYARIARNQDNHCAIAIRALYPIV